jgi:hypothetical protein
VLEAAGELQPSRLKIAAEAETVVAPADARAGA